MGEGVTLCRRVSTPSRMVEANLASPLNRPVPKETCALLQSVGADHRSWTLMVRAMLGLELKCRERRLLVTPVIPEGDSVVELSGMLVFGSRHDLRGWSAG